MQKFKHYTKSDLKIIKDMSLSDNAVATLINRTKQAVYCKRWIMGLYGKKKKLSSKPTVSETPLQVKKVVDHIIKTKQFKKLVVGNITIDLENQVVTIAM
jgi:hypothetical protein